MNEPSERDEQIWHLARKATNALGFALQNAHNETAQMKYDKQCMEAMDQLYELLNKPRMGLKK